MVVGGRASFSPVYRQHTLSGLKGRPRSSTTPHAIPFFPSFAYLPSPFPKSRNLQKLPKTPRAKPREPCGFADSQPGVEP